LGDRQHVQVIVISIDQHAEAATGYRDCFLNRPQSIGESRITVVTVPNQSPLILSEMKSVAVLYPAKRVRAVDQDGKLIDIL
jgi:hypothetical protein